MIKRTLIAIAVVALLATSAHAGLTERYFKAGDHSAVKVDGSDTVRWPWDYRALDVCVIPIKMNIGMFVQVIDCNKKKVILNQVSCSDIGKGDNEYPCYKGCVEFAVRANFEAKMGQWIEKGDLMPDADCWYEGGDVVPGDGDPHNMKVCVKAWNVKIYKHVAGDEVDVGKLHITVKPNV